MRRVLIGMLVLAAAAGLWLAVSSRSGKPNRIREAAAVKTVRVVKRRPRAHPQVIQPQAGVAAPSYGTPTTPTPVGDPTAHAPPLSKIKQELKILNLCGGATSPAYAQPVVQAS